MVPAVIHFMSRDGKCPPRLQFCVDSFRKQNPTFQIRFWSDQEIDSFMKEHFKEQYDLWIRNTRGFRGALKKWDTARVCILLTHGGFYSDNDCTCLRSLETLRSFSAVVRRPIQRWGEQYRPFSFTTLPHSCQAFFGCEPGSPLVREVLETIWRRALSRPDLHVETGTGCTLWAQVVEKFMEGDTSSVRLLEHFEYKEGPETIPWIPKDRFKELFVVHKHYQPEQDSYVRYRCFASPHTILQGRHAKPHAVPIAEPAKNTAAPHTE